MAGIVVESAVVKSFRLEPVDGSGLWLHEAGQYLPVRLKLPGDARHTSRVYTVSTAPSDGIYRISVRKQGVFRSEEHTSELQSLMRISYAVFCLKKQTI